MTNQNPMKLTKDRDGNPHRKIQVKYTFVVVSTTAIYNGPSLHSME